MNRLASTLASLLAASSLLAGAAHAAISSRVFYVAPNGRDTWTGLRPSANAAKTDGPFATVERAQQAVRRLPKTRPNRVVLRGGLYPLKKPLQFGPDDSGAPNAPVTYAAYPRETPVLSGGERITGWRLAGQGRWQVTLPDVRSGRWNFIQLFVNGQRRFRPRLPKSGYAFIADGLPPTTANTKDGFDQFRFAPGQIRANWHNLEDVEVLPFHIWTMSRFRIQKVDAATNTVSFTGHTRGTSYWAGMPKGGRFLVENVREALNTPGEWYLDRTTGVLTYLPMPGEKMDRAEVVAPRIEQLLLLNGSVAEKRWVHDLAFDGLTFAHANWVTPKEGHSFQQAEADVSAAVNVEGARRVVFRNGAVAHVGGYGVRFGAGCQGNTLDNMEIDDLGAGGVILGELKYTEDPDALASHQTVRNCRIAHGGRLHNAGIGVFMGHSPYNVVEHNDIHDFYYTGISVGWSWGYGKSGAHHNTIAWNNVGDLGQGVLSDMGGIYSLGVSPGSVIHHNRFHDVRSFSYGGWGIYFDEGTTGMVAENNLSYNTKSAPFHQHYGKENIVRNNVFAFGQEAEVMRTRPEEHRSFTFERNIVTWTEGPLLGSNWSGNNYLLDYNTYWNAGKPFNFAGMTLAEWRAKGQDTHSVIADPRFVAPEKGNFSLRPGSPALDLGFKPIETKGIGRLTKSRTPDVKPPRAFPPPPPPQPVRDAFEGTAPGARPGLATVNEENEVAVVRVTEETAATGKRSLKFTDAPGQEHNYNPHIYYTPGFHDGVVVGRFALRVEPGATFYHEWRDSANPYHVGPSLRVEETGSLLANGKRLMALPMSQWVRLEVTCPLGAKAKGRYDLVVRSPGAASPARFTGLSCSPDFAALDWYGFTADGVKAATFYLDDVNLERTAA